MSVKGRGWVGASVKDTNIRCSHPEPVARGGGGGGGNRSERTQISDTVTSNL